MLGDARAAVLDRLLVLLCILPGGWPRLDVALGSRGLAYTVLVDVSSHFSRPVSAQVCRYHTGLTRIWVPPDVDRPPRESDPVPARMPGSC